MGKSWLRCGTACLKRTSRRRAFTWAGKKSLVHIRTTQIDAQRRNGSPLRHWRVRKQCLLAGTTNPDAFSASERTRPSASWRPPFVAAEAATMRGGTSSRGRKRKRRRQGQTPAAKRLQAERKSNAAAVETVADQLQRDLMILRQ